MSDKDRRLGVSEINLVTRHLKLVPCDEAAIQAAIADIDQLYGLESVSYDSRKSRLHLAYDATRICLDCVEDILRKHAVEVSHDWWTRLKEEHYRFVDQNVKDNATHEPWSCHQKTHGSGKRR